MAKIRDDFPLPELVMPEFLRPGSELYNMVPTEVHEARRLIASLQSLDMHDLERWLVEEYTREPSASRPPEAFKVYDFRTKLELFLEEGHPLAGSDFPYFKPTAKCLRTSYETCFTSLKSRFSFEEELKNGNVQVTIEPVRSEAPYVFFFRYLKNPPGVAAVLYFGVTYHSWKDHVTFNHLASDYRTQSIFTQGDVPELLKRGCDYINGISTFLEKLDRSNQNISSSKP